ncbi:MAG: protein prkA, partial [Candidatus Dormibacteraceae bacterium]
MFEEIGREARELSATVTFETYLGMVREDPRLARTSLQRIHDMILAAGTTTAPDGGTAYRLFDDELFGAEGAVRAVVAYFAAGARGLDLGRRIPILVGPPGSGKSTLIEVLKRGLERYTSSAEGAVYAIAGCPIHEDPLHLVPVERRSEAAGLSIPGELCPACRRLLRDAYQGDIGRVPVRRIAFSAAEGVAIGTFIPSDPHSEDLTRLVGHVDRALLASADPDLGRRAFMLDGELDVANRGLADLVDVLKMDERFLSVMLTASEERRLKVDAPGLIDIDEAIVAQTNLAEFEATAVDARAAALLDRLLPIPVGYALAVGDEVRIYRKLLGRADLQGVHLSPPALRLAAAVAVLSRLRGPLRASDY